jgi:glucose/arabinose dehydrogenase
MPRSLAFALLLFAASLAVPAPRLAADDKNPKESDYYQLEALPIPQGVVLEAGGLQLMPDGRLAVSTRRGDIYMVHNPLAANLDDVQFRLYATQRCEVSRLKDQNNDGRADVVETVADGWEINGDYHEYAFGSKFDKEGNIWVALCLTGSFGSDVLYRGWCVRVTPDGKTIPTASGLRSPGGIGMNAAGDMFFTDNQGPWNGTCSLKWLRPGSFQGHPGGNKWYKNAAEQMGPQPVDPVSGSRIMTEAKRIPEFEPPACHFPYNKMGQSASGIACDTTGGKFGPFENQLFVGDQTHSTVMRVFLEQVNGHYQGACFMFRQGFGSGALSLEMTPSGALFVGGTNRGWGSRGNKPFSLDRLTWTGQVPFEIKEMRARHDGFELTFTRPVDPATASDVKSYDIKTYCYIFQSAYGSPEVDHTTPTIEKATVSADGLSVRLVIQGLVEGHIHELKAKEVRSTAGGPLLHDTGYYTLNYLPAKE